MVWCDIPRLSFKAQGAPGPPGLVRQLYRQKDAFIYAAFDKAGRVADSYVYAYAERSPGSPGPYEAHFRQSGYSMYTLGKAEASAPETDGSVWDDLGEAYMPIVQVMGALMSDLLRALWCLRPGVMLLLADGGFKIANGLSLNLSNTHPSAKRRRVLHFGRILLVRVASLITFLVLPDMPPLAWLLLLAHSSMTSFLQRQSENSVHIRMYNAMKLAVRSTTSLLLIVAFPCLQVAPPSGPHAWTLISRLANAREYWPRWKLVMAIKSHILIFNHMAAAPILYYHLTRVILALFLPASMLCLMYHLKL